MRKMLRKGDWIPDQVRNDKPEEMIKRGWQNKNKEERLGILYTVTG